MNRKLLPEGFIKALAWAFAGHLVLVLVGVFGSAVASGPPKVQRHITAVKLVKLGKKRDKLLLPRLSQPAPPAPKKAPPKKSPEAKATVKAPSPDTPPKPSAMDALKRAKDSSSTTSSTLSALDRLKKNLPVEEVEGDPEGDAAGEALVQALGSKFGAEIHRCMKANWHIEGVSNRAMRGKVASVLVRVGADGRILSHELTKKSGVAAVDRAVETAVKRCGKVSAPHPELRERVRKHGVEINFKV